VEHSYSTTLCLLSRTVSHLTFTTKCLLTAQYKTSEHFHRATIQVRISEGHLPVTSTTKPNGANLQKVRGLSLQQLLLACLSRLSF